MKTQVPITHGFAVRVPWDAEDQCSDHNVNVTSQITIFQRKTAAHVFQVRVQIECCFLMTQADIIKTNRK